MISFNPNTVLSIAQVDCAQAKISTGFSSNTDAELTGKAVKRQRILQIW